MPAALWTRIAFVSLFAVMLIPVALSSQRGLSHTLTCTERAESPFQVVMIPGEEPVITGAAVLDGGPPEVLCDGLSLEFEALGLPSGKVEVTVSIANSTEFDWFGTVQFEISGTRIPLDLGKVRAGGKRQASLALTLPEGVTQLNGRLLVGP